MNKNVLIVIMLSLLILAGCTDSATENDNDVHGNGDYILVSTNQSSFYNNSEEISEPAEGEAFYGQDAQYQAGEPVSYEVNDDSTVTDLNTGLIWEQTPDPDGFMYQEAVEYCENLELGGYDDWRMPTLKDLFSISDFNSGWPYIDMEYFDLATGEITKDEQYWSTNEYVGVTVEGGNTAAFGVNHVTGHIKAYPAGDEMPPPPENGLHSDPPNPFTKQVRAVRGESYGENEFVDNADGTITDNATGLMWTQMDSEEGIDWENALAYAENSEYAGYSDWRLPNVKELQSIVDYSYAPGAEDADKDRAAIDLLFSCTPITNEAGVDDFGYYWTSTSAKFSDGEPFYYAWYVAFGRAVNGEGLDFHGAGAVRFDTKVEGGPAGEGGERYYNYVRLVRYAE